MKILKNLRNDLVRLRNLSSEKKGNIRNSPLLEKTHCFLYSDTECILKLDNQSLSINKMMQCYSLVIGVHIELAFCLHFQLSNQKRWVVIKPESKNPGTYQAAASENSSVTTE